MTDDRPPTPAGADPPVQTPPVRWSGPEGGSSFGGGVVITVIGGVLLAVAALVIVVAFRSGSIATHPPARELPHPIRDAVVLVPLGDFPVGRANEIAAKEAADYGLAITVASPLAIPATAFDSGRGQLTAERLAEALAGAHPEGYGRILVIGLTTQDIYLAGRPDWRFAFGARNQSGVAVVSSARMGRFLDVDGEWNRLTKMVTRDIGFLYYDFPATSDPGDILYDNILSLEDLIRIGDHL
jgi:predicted Zn-dependent protease